MEKHRVEIFGSEMAYIEAGDGDPIVFLHGNPTSSYLWRNVIPHVVDLGRCIAPDLIGMGGSAKVPGLEYRFVDHRRYLDALLDAIGVEDAVTFVVHDWGSALGFDWANRHRDSVAGIAYMEAIVRPVSWDDWPESSRPIFQAMRSASGEVIVLEKNVFVERILPASVIRELSDDEMGEYCRPFLSPGEDRRPTLTWPREIPIAGEPGDVAAIVDDYGRWLSTSDVPKLFIDANPGAILVGSSREFCRGWPNQTEVTVRGTHFIQEDSPDEIGAALRRWMENR
ncbi:MAG: haloalkane dehalogenase [Actinomycetota bacterium]|nr:haloalkane dehalogenase [Actinomycetota bacterium]